MKIPRLRLKPYRDWKIRTKLISLTLLLSLGPLGLGAMLSLDKFTEALQKAYESDLAHIVNNISAMCKAQQELLQNKLDADFRIARQLFYQRSPYVSISTDRWVELEAEDQTTHEVSRVRIPLWLIGGQRITLDATLVDKVQEWVGGTCTVFQRIDQDRLLRIATNVRRADGSRAVGTYLPASSEVTKTILRGEVYRGRAYVVNRWYITVYEPIRDPKGEVIGALYVGIPEQTALTLERAIRSIKIGQSGYAYIMDSAGNLVVHPAKEGENILRKGVTGGSEFIEEIARKAPLLAENQVGTIRYPWRNEELGETRPRLKINKYQYFRDWDWIIVAGGYEDEIFGGVAEAKYFFTIVALGSGALAIFLTVLLSRFLTRPLTELNEITARLAAGDLSQKARVISGDEIGTLAKSFNAMAGQLLAYTRNLEEIVRARTEEIQEKEENYRNLSQLLQSILESSTEYSIIATDPDGIILRFNSGSEKLFGWSSKEVVGRVPIAYTFREEDRFRGVIKEFFRAVEVKGSTEYEMERVRKDGTLFQALAVLTPLKDSSGKTMGFLEIARDITEKNLLQKELWKTMEYLENIIQSSVDAIVTTNPKGKITLVNRAMEELVGLPREKLIGQPIFQFYAGGIEEARRIMATLREKGSLKNYETTMVGSGRSIPILTSASLLRDESGAIIGTLGVFKDLTEKKKLEEELKKTQTHLFQTGKMRALGELVAGVAHELNNPLMAAEAFLHGIRENMGDNEEIRRRVELIQQCHDRIARIVNHLRDFSRQSKLDFRRVRITDPIENALLITGQHLLNRGIRIVKEFPPDLPKIWGDPNQLEQVFLNLISNARDAMEKVVGRRVLTIRASLIRHEGWDEIEVQVKDTGAGIPEEHLDKIFEPFFTTKEVGEGTGLGLSICYGILEAHGGKIEVESKVGEGTTFRLTLPVMPHHLQRSPEWIGG
jgi:PAS domain S-box-containing protein